MGDLDFRLPGVAQAQPRPAGVRPLGDPTLDGPPLDDAQREGRLFDDRQADAPLRLGLQSDGQSLEEPLADVRVEGNVTIPPAAIAKFIKSRPGRPLPQKDMQRQIQDDVRALYGTRWFFSVEPILRQTDAGLVLVYRVVERPMVNSVEYRGNSKIKTKHLEALTNIKVGGPFDVSANRESVRRIEAHYKEKGFTFVEVVLAKGDHKDDRDVIFQIEEGPKVVVNKVKFQGNDSFNSSLLKTKLRTKTAFFGVSLLGGKYDPTTIPDDIASLKDYYHSLGYFDVKIDHRVGFSEDRSKAQIEYTIDEGERFRVRNSEFRGNEVFPDEELGANMRMASGDYFNRRFLRKDVERIQQKYGETGRLFAGVEPIPRFLEEPGVVDMVYRIDEDKVYRIGRINVNYQGDHPHSRESLVLNRMLVHPGDLADPNKIRLSSRRLEGSQFFERGMGNGVRIDLKRRDSFDVAQADDKIVRGQIYDEFNLNTPPPNPIFQNSPQGDPLQPTFREPMPNWVDLDVFATEARTGRLMFGVGVNSDAGVVGSIILEENNFDILRPPQTFRDIIDGTAWRGGGQRFRIEAIPGNIVSRYLVSWQDPFFLDTDYNFGVSGFYYNRWFEDWDEDRLGGRITLGRQFTPEISLTGALRVEEVGIRRVRVPTPQILQDVAGSDSLLSTFQLTAAHDTRDAPFLPAEGHLITLSYEQAFGDFSYPRFEGDAHQYFTIFNRPDGGGRHILSVGGQLGWTGRNTPVFERFFAGGFQTFRGFDFRGVTPREFGVGIGGIWSLLGSVEYMFPLTADENIQAVVFSDFGTVEERISVDDFRVTAGAGLRLTIPAMGPVPVAFDWAVPIVRQRFDDVRIFSFYVGLTR